MLSQRLTSSFVQLASGKRPCGKKIKEYQEKGWIVPSKSHWLSQEFLVPQPSTNKWRLVIDYRYVNTQVRGCKFPLPVIEDLFVKQAGNQLWTLLDLEDVFRQMSVSECSRQYTAFCTPFGVFEWRVLPMGRTPSIPENGE